MRTTLTTLARMLKGNYLSISIPILILVSLLLLVLTICYPENEAYSVGDVLNILLVGTPTIYIAWKTLELAEQPSRPSMAITIDLNGRFRIHNTCSTQITIVGLTQRVFEFTLDQAAHYLRDSKLEIPHQGHFESQTYADSSRFNIPIDVEPGQFAFIYSSITNYLPKDVLSASAWLVVTNVCVQNKYGKLDSENHAVYLHPTQERYEHLYKMALGNDTAEIIHSRNENLRNQVLRLPALYWDIVKHTQGRSR